MRFNVVVGELSQREREREAKTKEAPADLNERLEPRITVSLPVTTNDRQMNE